MLPVKLILIGVFFIIFFQDVKDRMVYWFLYPAVGILGFYIHFNNSAFLPVMFNLVMNITLILFILGFCYLYSKYVMRRKFVNESMGTGDILLLIFLCFTFATITFIVFLVFSLFFSIIIHKILSNKKAETTVPLAGYISLFFAFIYCGSMLVDSSYLFSY